MGSAAQALRLFFSSITRTSPFARICTNDERKCTVCHLHCTQKTAESVIWREAYLHMYKLVFFRSLRQVDCPLFGLLQHHPGHPVEDELLGGQVTSPFPVRIHHHPGKALGPVLHPDEAVQRRLDQSPTERVRIIVSPVSRLRAISSPRLVHDSPVDRHPPHCPHVQVLHGVKGHLQLGLRGLLTRARTHRGSGGRGHAADSAIDCP